MGKNLSDILNDIEPLEIIGDKNRVVSGVVFDSREATTDSLFVAVKGTQVDGHVFIDQVVRCGATVVVCEELPATVQEGVTFVKVESSSIALGELSAAFYDHPSSELKLIGITGTNGKTTVATLMYELVEKLGYKAGLFSTVANYVGSEKTDATHTTPDPVSLNGLLRNMVEAGCEYCFMEVSSHSVDQGRIAGLQFYGGVFTNLTHDHLDYHKTFDAYLKAKKLFFDGLPASAFALVNIDDKNGRVMVQNSKARICSYSLREMADFKARIIESMFEGMHLSIDGREVWTPCIGKFNAQNLLAVYGVAINLGFDKDETLLALSLLQPVDGRFETIRSKKGVTAVVDYAHTPDALKNVIDSINQIRQPEQKLVTVVGAGGDRDKTKRPEMGKEAVAGSTKVIFTSDNPRSEVPEKIIEDMMEGVGFKDRIKVLSISNRREAIRTGFMLAEPGDIVLVAGKGHETYQEIQGVKHHFDDKEVIREIFKQQI